MFLKTPQIILLILMVLGLGIHMAKHGQSQGEYNGWIKLVDVCIAIALLYWGGFFN